MPQAHSILSPSGLQLATNCEASVLAGYQLPDEPQSEAARKGTLAHNITENAINSWLLSIGKMSKEPRDEGSQFEYSKSLLAHPDWSEELNDRAMEALYYAKSLIQEILKKHPDAKIFTELQLSLEPFVKDGFGTCDLIIIVEGKVYVIDWKFGRYRVLAENNQQIMAYGLSALQEFDLLYSIQQVEMHIVQPTIDNVSVWTLSASDLLDWGYKDLKPLAKRVLSGNAEFSPGSHCGHCKVRAVCRARSEYNLHIAEQDFGKPSDLLTDDELARVVKKVDEFSKWAEDIRSYMLQQSLTTGKHWSGCKIVESRTQRKYSDTDLVASRLAKNGYGDSEIFQKRLINLTSMKRLLGAKKFGSIIEDLLVKPKGQPKLVPDDDPRPTYKPSSDATEDFSKP